MKKNSVDNLLKTYGKKVFNLAYRLTGNKQDAEDVTGPKKVKNALNSNRT